ALPRRAAHASRHPQAHSSRAQSGQQDPVGCHCHRRRVLPRRGGAQARRADQRDLAGSGLDRRVRDRLPLLRQVRRTLRIETRPHPRATLGAAQRRPRLRTHRQVGGVRPPFRRDRRRRPAGRPGTLWILFGVVFAGAVQDFMILGLSLRRDARSLGHMLREELGPVPGIVAMIGVLVLMMIVLAVLALVVVKALTHSPWGTFTVAATIPIALLMGVYLRWFRVGRILEVSIIGLVLLLVSIWLGRYVAESATLAPLFDFDARALAWWLIAYGFCASVLPVWLLLAPRDYLSTFLKIGTIALLALAIFLSAPMLQMPAVTKFIDGSGPVFSGNLFPFLFITIACGAVSGWHSIIASGTTPKLLANEGQARMVGYGGMLMEAFVAIMAMVAAVSLHPGVYFAMNAPGAIIATTVEHAAQVISQWGFVVTPDELIRTAKDVGEQSILSRAGGAPTLAVGMAQLLHNILPGEGMMAFWYHYAILFEALFILTTVDAGTRVGRFMIQEIVGLIHKPLQGTESWTGNLLATA